MPRTAISEAMATPTGRNICRIPRRYSQRVSCSAPVTPGHRDFLDTDATRKGILDGVVAGIKKAYPVGNELHELHLENPHFPETKQYTLGEFYQEYQELPISTQAEYAGPDGMKNLAESLIERLLLVEDTYDQLLDVQNKPLADESRLQVIKQMMHQEEVDDKIQVTDEEMQKYYDENIDLMALPPKARIRYIRIGLGQTEDEQQAARARADEAYQKLVPGLFQQGASFAEVAQEYSEDPESAAQGGEFPDWIGESEDILAEVQLHPFHEIVLSLQPEEISQPFEFGDSLYIVQVIERTGAEQLPFEQAKPYIEEILSQQKHDEQMVQLQETLLEQANFVLYPTVLEKYFQELQTPAPLNPSP